MNVNHFIRGNGKVQTGINYLGEQETFLLIGELPDKDNT